MYQPDAVRTAGDIVAAAAVGEVIEVRSSRLTSRKHRVSATGSRSAPPVTGAAPAMIRLARQGRDAYLAMDHVSHEAIPDILDQARELARSGRPYRDAAPTRARADWDEKRHVDTDLAQPEQPLIRLWQACADAAEDVGRRLQLTLQVRDCLVTEERDAEVFVSSGGEPLAFTRTRVETKVLVEVEQQRQRTRLWAAMHHNRLADLPLQDLLTEAALRGATILAGTTPAPQTGSTLLLAPRPAAAMLRMIAHDVFEHGGGPRPGDLLRHHLVDDAHAAGGQHSRPFDHEGSPTGRTVLLDAYGNVALMAARGSRDAPGLTGNAYAHEHRGAPEPKPTNVGLAGPVRTVGETTAVDRFSGMFGFNLRGHGTQQFRTGNLIRFRIETALIRDGRICGRGPDLMVTATSAQLVAAVDAVADTGSYLPWRDYSTAFSWILLGGLDRIASVCP